MGVGGNGVRESHTLLKIDERVRLGKGEDQRCSIAVFEFAPAIPHLPEVLLAGESRQMA